MEQCEPEAWKDAGGDWATMRYYQGVLIIRAPDYIHRQIDGYRFAPVRTRSAIKEGVKRYVTFSGEVSVVQNLGFDTVTVTGAVGGQGGGGNGGGGSNGGAPIAKPDAGAGDGKSSGKSSGGSSTKK